MTSNHAAVATLRAALNARYKEREDIVDGIIMALLSGEHVVLLGPPGTAKSAVARDVSKTIGLRYYEKVLNRFTTPPELFGNMSLKGLENDEVRFNTANMLPEAEIAFIDEIFKSNAALLNAFLALINERIFHNGSLGAQRVPLRSMIGASNELPQADQGLEALWDRILLRYDFGYIRGEENFKGMMRGDVDSPLPGVSLSIANLDAAMAEVAAMKVSDDVIDALFQCRGALSAEGVVASDRRWKRSLKVVQAFSWLNSQPECQPEDLMVLQHSLWNEPKMKGKVARTLAKVVDSAMHQACEILDAARESARQYEASPKGVNESVRFGSALRAAKTKAEGLLKQAKGAKATQILPIVNEITVLWKDVIRVSANATGAKI